MTALTEDRTGSKFPFTSEACEFDVRIPGSRTFQDERVIGLPPSPTLDSQPPGRLGQLSWG